jgi:hypothetical protein
MSESPLEAGIPGVVAGAALALGALDGAAESGVGWSPFPQPIARTVANIRTKVAPREIMRLSSPKLAEAFIL